MPLVMQKMENQGDTSQIDKRKVNPIDVSN